MQRHFYPGMGDAIDEVTAHDLPAYQKLLACRFHIRIRASELIRNEVNVTSTEHQAELANWLPIITSIHPIQQGCPDKPFVHAIDFYKVIYTEIHSLC